MSNSYTSGEIDEGPVPREFQPGEIVETGVFADVDSMLQGQAKTCLNCKNITICKVFAMYKDGIVPHLMDEGKDSGLAAENLAWICKLYVPKPVERSTKTELTKMGNRKPMGRDF